MLGLIRTIIKKSRHPESRPTLLLQIPEHTRVRTAATGPSPPEA
jgi:hypothetical protein